MEKAEKIIRNLAGDFQFFKMFFLPYPNSIYKIGIVFG